MEAAEGMEAVKAIETREQAIEVLLDIGRHAAEGKVYESALAYVQDALRELNPPPEMSEDVPPSPRGENQGGPHATLLGVIDENFVDENFAPAQIDLTVHTQHRTIAYLGVLLLDENQEPLSWTAAVDALAWRETMQPDKRPRVGLMTFKARHRNVATVHIEPFDKVTNYRRHQE